MIRPATGVDIPAMVRMGGDFIAASGTGLPFDPDYVASSLRIHLGTGGRFSVVLDVDGEARGMLCAMAYRSPLAPVAVAQELAFWIDPEHRGRGALAMVRAYIEWAKEQGCERVTMMALGDRSLDAFYGRLGLQFSETVYSKVLK